MKRNNEFDVIVQYQGHRLRITGSVDPGCRQTGPTWDCGGTPAEPASIEDTRIWMIRNDRQREIQDYQGNLAAELEPDIFEALNNDADAAREDRDEARYRQSMGE